MSLKNSLSLLFLGLALVACDDKTDDTGGEADADTDSDSDADADADADSDADADADTPKMYEDYAEGSFFALDYGRGFATPGEPNCQYVWWMDGTASYDIPAACDSCDFVIDTNLLFDDWEFSNIDDLCTDYGLDSDWGFTMANGDYYGYGDTLLYGYYGYYTPFGGPFADYGYYGPASFDGSYWEWYSGYRDYPYLGYYYSYVWALGATLIPI